MLLLLTSQSVSRAATKAELLGALFSELKYPDADKAPLPGDIIASHKYAKAIGASMKYGFIPKTPFSPDAQINRHEAVKLALMMMGWGFEASLYESFESLPGLGGSGDPVFFLASEMQPPAPKGLLLDGMTPLSDSGKDAILSWVRNCMKSVRWNRVLSYSGVDLVIYRQGVAMPGVPNDHPKGGNPLASPLCEPLFVAALAVHQDAADARIAFAGPLGIGAGRAPITEISNSYDAIAAVNGGFFAEGRPLGTMLQDGLHAGKPLPGRSAVGWDNAENLLVFGGGNARIGVFTPSGYVEFSKFNVPPPPNEAALYTPGVAISSMGTALDALEIVVREGVVAERREISAGNRIIPRDGFVILARGNSRSLLDGLEPGSQVNILTDWETPAFSACSDLIQAGPMLMRNGQFINNPETFKPDILDKRHPRTIMGSDGSRMFWAVIDGRNNLHSRGATIEETRWIARSLGLVNAINMDGGGSSQLVWRGLTINLPSDGKERPLPYALLMMPKGSMMIPKNLPSFGGYDSPVREEYGEWGPPPGAMDSIIMDTYDPMRDVD
ncbi:MAG: phosphodiester glycosidase family protein [Synergistaceae bacterium]|nr:phosphodiester glycosidase family protein [Synergistaceae bacterium]